MISPIILAMDTDDLDIAKRWISLTNGSVGVYKLGLEFFLKFGPDGIVEIENETDCEIFLDLKLHDIPNTVGAATAQVASLKPKFLTVHASGGPAMIAAVAQAVPHTDVTAVTILTSLSEDSSSSLSLEFLIDSSILILDKPRDLISSLDMGKCKIISSSS